MNYENNQLKKENNVTVRGREWLLDNKNVV
jgi:hypothetical protein